MNVDLNGKIAFVTGGSKGIGKAIAETLADCGANIGVMACGTDELDALSPSSISNTAEEPWRFRAMFPAMSR